MFGYPEKLRKHLKKLNYFPSLSKILIFGSVYFHRTASRILIFVHNTKSLTILCGDIKVDPYHMEIQKKKSKLEDRAEEDRISKLPDELLCHILSFMPTKYAFRTSTLSTRWKDTWACIPNLDFRCSLEDWENKGKCKCLGFAAFVDRVLSFRGDSDIRKFRLQYYCCSEGFSRIADWIRIAIKHNVVELDLCVETDVEDDRTFELPQCVFMSKSLVILKVDSGCITYAPPTSGCFPSLKSLDLRSQYPDIISVERMFCCCPVLEHLSTFAYVGLDDVLNFRISAPALKNLQLILPHDSFLESNDHKYWIFINCPELENIDLRLDFLPNFVFENVKSLVKARLDLFARFHEDELPGFSSRATELLAGISKVKDLSLSAHSVEACSLPAFVSLKQLELVLHDCYNWDLLTELLRRSPNLEYLVIDHKEDDNDSCIIGSSQQEILRLFSENQWCAPESVPACLISSIKTIAFREFKGYPHEQKVAKYLLDNGKVLKKMSIYNEVLKELFDESSSSSCRVDST